MKINSDPSWVFTPEIKTAISVSSAEQFLSSDHLFLTILESIQDGVSVLDTDLNVKYVNASMKHWHKIEKIENQKCYEIYHGRQTPCEKCPTLHCMQTKKPQVELVRYITNSDYGWQQIYSVPILNKDNEIVLIIEYVRDITFQKSVENNLEFLEERFSALEKQNKLLLEMLHQREHQQEELERTINENVERFIRPSLNYLKKSIKDEKDIHMVSGIIDEVVFPITKKRSSALSFLTPKEMQVATLIKENYSSQEIADKMFVTKKAVDYHRTNIRKKLGLKRSENLQVYLSRHL